MLYVNILSVYIVSLNCIVVRNYMLYVNILSVYIVSLNCIYSILNVYTEVYAGEIIFDQSILHCGRLLLTLVGWHTWGSYI